MTASPTEHRDVLRDLFTRVTDDAALIGLRPVGVMVRTYEVSVQMRGEDTAAVDALAELYGLRPNDPNVTPSLYDRRGRVEVAGHLVDLGVYTGAPAKIEVPA